MTSGARVEPRRRLALDTSAYSRFRAGDTRVLDLLADAEAVLVPATVLGELHGAFELGSRARENRVALSEFPAEPFVRVLWIAAAAIDQGACLLTFDHGFDRVPTLERIVLDRIELESPEQGLAGDRDRRDLTDLEAGRSPVSGSRADARLMQAQDLSHRLLRRR